MGTAKKSRCFLGVVIPVFLLIFFVFSCKSQTPAETETSPESAATQESPQPVPPPKDTDPQISVPLETSPESIAETPEITLPPELPEERIIEVPLPDPTMPEIPEPSLPEVSPPPVESPVQEPAAQVPPAPAIPPAQEAPAVTAPVPQTPPQQETPPEPPPFMRLPERDNSSAPQGTAPAAQTALPALPSRQEPSSSSETASPSLPSRSESSPPSVWSSPLDPPSPVIPPSRAEPPAITPVLDEQQIVISRTVKASVGQLVEIPFRGAGWIYLEEQGSRRGVSYESRRLDPEGHTFVFRAEAAGTYLLKFFRRDNIRDYDLYDYVQVIVGEASALSDPPEALIDRSRITAGPRWPETDGATAPAVTPNERNPSPPQSTGTSSVQSDSYREEPAPANGDTSVSAGGAPYINPDEYVSRAKTEFDAGRVAQAISIMNELSQLNPDLDDEALWLYGQLMESNSPARDIRAAMDCYNKLIREYPQSPRVADAQRRIAYLERYYFNIR